MIVISEDELEAVAARTQRDLNLGLTIPEMEMLGVIGDWNVGRLKLRVDEKVMVPGPGLLRASGRYAHVAKPDADLETAQDSRTVEGIMEVNVSAGRSRRALGVLGGGAGADRGGAEAD